MKLEQMRTNYLSLDVIGRLEFMTNYQQRREVDLNTVLTQTKPSRAGGRKKAGKKIAVNIEQLDMLKKLGLI